MLCARRIALQPRRVCLAHPLFSSRVWPARLPGSTIATMERENKRKAAGEKRRFRIKGGSKLNLRVWSWRGPRGLALFGSRMNPSGRALTTGTLGSAWALKPILRFVRAKAVAGPPSPARRMCNDAGCFAWRERPALASHGRLGRDIGYKGRMPSPRPILVVLGFELGVDHVVAAFAFDLAFLGRGLGL